MREQRAKYPMMGCLFEDVGVMTLSESAQSCSVKLLTGDGCSL
jgi:hypothetical protein